jgi:hypothetical protein
MKRISLSCKTSVTFTNRTPCCFGLLLLLAGLMTCFVPKTRAADLDLAGITVTPHVQSSEMRYRRDPDPGMGARVQLFLRNESNRPLALPASLPVRFRASTPDELLRNGAWAWHDTPSAWPSNDLTLPPGALTVWAFNGKGTNWGVRTSADIMIDRPGQTPQQIPFCIEDPSVWLSAVTFLSKNEGMFPDTLVFHIANQSPSSVRMVSCRLWLPESNSTWRALLPQSAFTHMEMFPSTGIIPANDKGIARIATGKLPLSYGAVEVQITDSAGKTASLWAHLRIKRESLDISGGWVASRLDGSNTLHCEAYLKTLRRMHVNTGMHDQVPGYTDNTVLYAKYPLKYMNRCQPFEIFDNDVTLPRVHAVEFLGEPQFGGGRPVPPMDVWRAFCPYQATRMPTSVTHSEERIWRYYAGLSDYPHFDAYRVCAPAPDAWSRYDRWEGKTIRWGAPLETIGDMTRSLRNLNRPAPIAYWSQGAHDGWDRIGGRQRTSPTPDELRLQAYQALAQRITSIYWFNLSLKSILKFPDLIEPITRVDREIRLLDDFYLEGDAYYFERRTRNGKPDWDLAVVAGPRGALCFALDLAYTPDPEEKVFKFGPPREVALAFPLPAYMRRPAEVLHVDADGVQLLTFTNADNGIRLTERCGPVNIFAVSPRSGMSDELKTRIETLMKYENSFDFDPGRSAEDLEKLRQLAKP